LLLASVGNDIGSKTAVTDARTLADYTKAAQDMYGPDAAAFLKLFPAKNDAEAATQAKGIARISGFGIVARDWAKDASLHAKSPIWLVQYNHPHPYPPGVVITDMDIKTAGAYHNSDLPFWYGTLDSLNLFRHTREWTPYDYKLSNQMQDVLVAFARTGNPNTAEVKIPRYDPKHEQRTVFGDNGTSMETLNEKQIDFIETHPAKH
jgi:para-nitrobenzyl esterase